MDEYPTLPLAIKRLHIISIFILKSRVIFLYFKSFPIKTTGWQRPEIWLTLEPQMMNQLYFFAA